MITKAVGVVLILIICVVILPIGFAVIGGVFGIVFGVFGAIIGILSAIFGFIMSIFGWIFHGFFHWNNHLFDCNIYTLGIIAVIVALIVRSGSNRK